jgi:outer membrane protein OmpA-like peptidoglycan-associated protein
MVADGLSWIAGEFEGDYCAEADGRVGAADAKQYTIRLTRGRVKNARALAEPPPASETARPIVSQSSVAQVWLAQPGEPSHFDQVTLDDVRLHDPEILSYGHSRPAGVLAGLRGRSQLTGCVRGTIYARMRAQPPTPTQVATPAPAPELGEGPTFGRASVGEPNIAAPAAPASKLIPLRQTVAVPESVDGSILLFWWSMLLYGLALWLFCGAALAASWASIGVLARLLTRRRSPTVARVIVGWTLAALEILTVVVLVGRSLQGHCPARSYGNLIALGLPVVAAALLGERVSAAAAALAFSLGALTFCHQPGRCVESLWSRPAPPLAVSESVPTPALAPPVPTAPRPASASGTAPTPSSAAPQAQPPASPPPARAPASQPASSPPAARTATAPAAPRPRPGPYPIPLDVALRTPTRFFERDCGQPISIVTDLLFNLDDARLKPDARPVLEMLRELIAVRPTRAILLDGHADHIGSYAYNMKLSLARANEVAWWLKANAGVRDEQITVAGHGDTEPVTDDPTHQDLNRRVDVRFPCVDSPD